jgi:hypothetical protein
MKYTNRREEVAAELHELMETAEERIEAGEVTVERVVAELAAIAFFPLPKCLASRRLLPCKLKALELLGKYLKMFVDRTEVDVSIDLRSRLDNALKRIQSMS